MLFSELPQPFHKHESFRDAGGIAKRVEVKSRPPARPAETNDGDDIARLVMERHNAASRATYRLFFSTLLSHPFLLILRNICSYEQTKKKWLQVIRSNNK